MRIFCKKLVLLSEYKLFVFLQTQYLQTPYLNKLVFQLLSPTKYIQYTMKQMFLPLTKFIAGCVDKSTC
eukprot:m.44222 g.44222  ORF g.44222 m.44222 type:complete len:69 (+) comp7158_c0_seq1:4770-4976(+)